ncbi:MAG: porphobilinogen synthase [Myxococcota bacterium]
MHIRPRRNRKSEAIRSAIREPHLGPEHLVVPLFVHEGADRQPIPSMPGCARLGLEDLKREVEQCLQRGVRFVVLFPAVPDDKKSTPGDEAYNPEGLIPTCLRTLKDTFPEVELCTDVALDPYSSDGHDGIVREGRILNDETIEVLVKQALCQADAGASVIAPSDMMDGRVGAIRDALDDAGHAEVSILSYTAKYASAFYGPFRDALESAPKAGDKKTYQMDPANVREAIREIELDVEEGADILMVKPALPYLDVLRLMREETELPIAAYQVSGEYAMLKAAAQKGWLDEDRAVLESLTAIRRAGADLIFTYYARHAADLLRR